MKLLCLIVLVLIVNPCVGCTTGDLRLTGSSSGILQICKNNEWRIVCSEDWGHLDAAVACKQLGYDGGYTQSTRSSNPEGITVDPVEYHCNGRESNLQTCNKGANSGCNAYDVTTIVCVRRNLSDPCSSGDIRLWGGQTEYEGNIELCNDHGVWSAVCDNGWGNVEAALACRQLNYTNSISVRIGGSGFGERIQPVEYGGLDCRGTESSLQQCGFRGIFVNPFSKLFFCNQRDYAGVRCIPREPDTCKNGDVRLTSGYSPNSGFAEICLDDVWIGICLRDYERHHPFMVDTDTILMHICNQLGYPRYTKIHPSFFLANKSEPPAYVAEFEDRYHCRSKSAVLLDCIENSTTYGISYTHTCASHGVLCCPNDTVSCLQQMTSNCPTTPPTTATTSSKDEAHFSLRFGTAATPLIMTLSGDLRGLEEDIQERVVSGISEECDCSFDLSFLKDGSFSLGEYVTYTGTVSAVDGQSAGSLVIMLKASIDKNPRIHFHNADLFFDVHFED